MPPWCLVHTRKHIGGWQDPKRHLTSYFEREHADLNYDTEQDGPGHARVYTCTYVPLDTSKMRVNCHAWSASVPTLQDGVQ